MWLQEVGEDIPTVLASEKLSEAVVNTTDVTTPGGRGQISTHLSSHNWALFLPSPDLSSIHWNCPPHSGLVLNPHYLSSQP